MSQIQIEEKTEETEEKVIQVCSGLVDYVPIEQMENRKVAVLANLKASKQRGVISEAMLLAAESPGSVENDGTRVELISPPAQAKLGEKLYFHPFTSGEYPAKLKSKVWENVQKHLRTNKQGEAVYVNDGSECLLKTIDETSDSARAESLSNAIIR